MSLVRITPTTKRQSLLSRLFPGHGRHRRNPLLDENLRLKEELELAEAARDKAESELGQLRVHYTAAQSQLVSLTEALRVSMAAHEANAVTHTVPMWVRPDGETTLTMPIPAEHVQVVQPVKPVRTPKTRGTTYMTMSQGQFHTHKFTHPLEKRPEADHAGITVVHTLHAALGATDIPSVFPVAP